MRNVAEKLSALRESLREFDIEGMILLHTDKFRREYVPKAFAYLEWLTNFPSSAGTAIILRDRAVFCVDGRYTEAAFLQIGSFFEVTDVLPEVWIAENVAPSERMGFDSWQVTEHQLKKIREIAPHLTFMPMPRNPIELLWAPPSLPEVGRISLYGAHLSGISSEEKLSAIASILERSDAQSLLLTDPLSVSWLLNVRAESVPITPAPPAYALVTPGEPVFVFVEGDYSLDLELQAPIARKKQIFRPFKDLLEALRMWPVERVLVDAGKTPIRILDLLVDSGKELLFETDPCEALKAQKNPVELQGFRDCHLRDGVALIELFAWLEEKLRSSTVSEIQVVEKLQMLLSTDPLFIGVSFETISAAGANTAFVHYRTPKGITPDLSTGKTFLLDAGAHYRNGTTDCTRTVGVGKVTDPLVRKAYTAVLKGLIALTMTIFPRGTQGSALDSVARRALWSQGWDYPHGTGHGVGHVLSVHEAQPSLSRLSHAPVEAGMVLSIEPGYYKVGSFGVRLENLVEVVEAPNFPGFLTFSTLTHVPFEPELTDIEDFSREERAWLQTYHAQVRTCLWPHLSVRGRTWLSVRCSGHDA